MNTRIKIVLIIALSLSCLQVMANGFSYVYIQGDKNIPFYVKFEDQMLPRYGKNYNIIPQLAPGPINIQVLFQQNAYPPQKFTIVVPEDGFRGFLLLKKGEVFSLYDIHQQFYLYPGNKAEDDKLPPVSTANAYVYTNTRVETPITTTVKKPAQTGIKPKDTPKFMANVELNNERTVRNNTQPVKQQEIQKEETDIPKEEVAEDEGEAYEDTYVPAETEPTAPVLATGRPIVNSDCPTGLKDGDFEDLYSKTQSKPEKSKLKFLLTKMDDCYTSNQARILAEALSNDPEKYTFLKRVYPRVTDQANFPVLESLLSTQEWKSYFKLILHK